MLIELVLLEFCKSGLKAPVRSGVAVDADSSESLTVQLAQDSSVVLAVLHPDTLLCFGFDGKRLMLLLEQKARTALSAASCSSFSEALGREKAAFASTANLPERNVSRSVKYLQYCKVGKKGRKNKILAR
jgi:hypothetical protein